MGYRVLSNDCITEYAAAGASIIPPSLEANTGELMLMFVGLSYVSNASATISTPSGWEVQSGFPKTQTDLCVYMFKRIATADGESFPEMTASETNHRWTIQCWVFEDPDTTTDPFSIGDIQVAQGASGIDNPDITLVKTRSWHLSYMAVEDIQPGATAYIKPANFKSESVAYRSTGSTEGTDHSCCGGVDFQYDAASTVIAGIDWTNSSSDDWIGISVEILTNDNTAPAKIDSSPLELIPTTDYAQGSDLTWISDILTSNVLPDGSTPTTWNFDASIISTPLTFNTGTSVDGTLETISISGHGLITGSTIHYSKNGGSASIGLTEGARYYSRKIDDNTISLWTDRSDCIANTTTTRANLSGSGSEIHHLRQYAIYVPSHAMDESMVVRVENNGNTLPTGLTNNEYYWVRPINADYIQLCGPLTTNVDAAGDFYYNGYDASTNSLPRALTAGTGTCVLRECRMVNSMLTDAVARANSGTSGNSNKGPAPGNYIGDHGENQNWLGYTRTFTTPRDMSTEVIAWFGYFLSAVQTDIARIILIDSDGDRMQWLIGDKSVGQATTAATNSLRQLQPGSSYVQSISEREVGTFNAASVKHILYIVRGTNARATRPGSNPLNAGDPYVISRAEIYGGIANYPLTLDDAVNKMIFISADLSSIPSDIQFVLNGSLQIGDGAKATYFIDSEKSIAFPPLANGTTKLYTYRETIGFDVNAASGDIVQLKNSQIGASAPFRVSYTLPISGQFNFDGNTYVLGNVVLDSDIIYDRQLFVGGDGITDNNAEIINSTFIIGSDSGPEVGIIQWNSLTDISDSTFEIGTEVISGHAISIDTSGSYTFDGLYFNNFGVNESSTAAVYNKSGGLVTINIAGGGDTPTYRNSVGSTTTIVAGATVTLTGLIAGSEVRAYLGTDPSTATQIDGEESSGTSFSFSQSYSGSDGFIVIHALGYVTQRISITYTSTDATIPIQQIEDRVYTNPT